MTLVCSGKELRMSTVGWRVSLFTGKQDVTAHHPELQRITDESRYGLCMKTYEPWAYDDRTLFLSNWEGKDYLYNVETKTCLLVGGHLGGVTALAAPRIPKFLTANAVNKCLIDLNGEVQAISVPCSGMSLFRWTDFSNLILVVGKHLRTRQPMLWFVDDTTGITTNSAVLDPLKLNSKIYHLGDLDHASVTYDPAAATVYIDPYYPGAQCWVLKLG